MKSISKIESEMKYNGDHLRTGIKSVILNYKPVVGLMVMKRFNSLLSSIYLFSSLFFIVHIK